ncbi:hypothetical protein ACFX2B_034190 [Malus domestica]
MAFHCVLVLLRWDIKAVENLPDYMKLCFLALYNTVNVMVYDTLKKEKTSTLMSQKLGLICAKRF